MANNYYPFSTYLNGPKEALDWLEAEAANYSSSDPDHLLPNNFEREDENRIWIADEDGTGLENALGLIARMQRLYPDCPPFTICQAYFCDKLRVDEFGGIGIVVVNGTISSMNIYDWCQNEIDRLKKWMRFP